MSTAWTNVLDAARENQLAVLDDAKFQQLVDDIVARYVALPASSWWWNRLKVPFRTHSYQGQDGVQVLANEIGDRSDLLLVVTDESPSGVGAVRGTTSELLDLVRNCIGFEFALVPEDLSWIVFDTHHNTLVFAGALAVSEAWRV